MFDFPGGPARGESTSFLSRMVFSFEIALRVAIVPDLSTGCRCLDWSSLETIGEGLAAKSCSSMAKLF